MKQSTRSALQWGILVYGPGVLLIGAVIVVALIAWGVSK